MKVKVEKPDRVVNEKGDHVGTILKKGFTDMTIYCFLCKKNTSSLKHYEQEH